MAIETVNPTTEEKIKTYEPVSKDKLNSWLEAGQRSFYAWAEAPISERAQKMKAAAQILEEKRDVYAKLMALEMGKPIPQGQSEIDKCAWVCEYFADHAERFLAQEEIQADSLRGYVVYRPLGIILAVMPWNFPFWQVFRCAAPALMAGNAVFLKHASNVPECALAIEDIFTKADFPGGLFRTLLIGSDAVSSLIENPLIRAVTLTGSTGAGKTIAAKAGQNLKKTVMELGGSDPYIILEDADLELAADVCAKARLINSGQSCIAAKRFIVVEPVRREFEKRFVEKMRSQKMGDPFQEGVTIGPLARHDLRDALHRQVEESVARGAKLLTGGTIPQTKGAYYPPTVLTDVKKGMPVYDEETFGPVAAIIPVEDEEEAIRVANDSSFGLGAAVFTRDKKRGKGLASNEVDAGSVFVNAQVHSDPRLPFGGIKESGYGRELSYFGIREFVNIKTVCVKA